STAAMTGFPSRKRVGPIGPSPSASTGLPPPRATAFRSAPAQKVPSTPVSTATASASSRSKARNASASAPAVGPSTALRTAGRLIVTTTTSLSMRTSTWLMRVLPCSARQPEQPLRDDVRLHLGRAAGDRAHARPEERLLPAAVLDRARRARDELRVGTFERRG